MHLRVGSKRSVFTAIGVAKTAAKFARAAAGVDIGVIATLS